MKTSLLWRTRPVVLPAYFPHFCPLLPTDYSPCVLSCFPLGCSPQGDLLKHANLIVPLPCAMSLEDLSSLSGQGPILMWPICIAAPGSILPSASIQHPLCPSSSWPLPSSVRLFSNLPWDLSNSHSSAGSQLNVSFRFHWTKPGALWHVAGRCESVLHHPICSSPCGCLTTLSLLLQRWQSLRAQSYLCLLAVLLLGQGLSPLRGRHQDGMSCAQGWLKEAFAGYRRGTEGGGVPAGEWQARNTEGRQFGPSHRGLLSQSCLLESSCVPPNGPALAPFFSSIPRHGGLRGC